MTSSNVTLRDVAKRAGVSIATVSRVLNDDARVRPELQEAVRAAIDELGYYRNSIARSLKTNTTMTIGFLCADISNPYAIVVARAVEDLVREFRYNLLVCSTEGDPEREREYLQVLMGRNIDGLVLNGTGLNKESVASISNRIPVVLVHRRYDVPNFRGDLVDSDNEYGCYALTRHLMQFGHRRIFVIKGEPHTSSNTERYIGFCRAMKESGITVNDRYPFQYQGDFTQLSGYQAVEHLCTLKEKPTAILALNNTMALGALASMKAHNLSVPEDFSIASYNDIEYKELMTIRPTVYSIDPRQIGLHVGNALLERLNDGEIPNRNIIERGLIIPGNAVSIPADSLYDKRLSETIGFSTRTSAN